MTIVLIGVENLYVLGEGIWSIFDNYEGATGFRKLEFGNNYADLQPVAGKTLVGLKVKREAFNNSINVLARMFC